VVLAARKGADTQARVALETLCRAYWYPLYAFVRRQGYAPEDAEDLTQAFFARFLEKAYLDDVDPSKGRFRSFLLAALRHFLHNEWDKQRTLKRGGAVQVVPLDSETAEGYYQIEPAHGLTPERLYEKSWATVLLARTLERLRQEYQVAGKGALFERIQVYLEGDRRQAPYGEVCRELAMGESALKMSVLRLRRRYGELLRQEITHVVADPAEVEDEIRALFAAVS
jgi:RNA polymerase sigma-70 factor (ECF subfamily)